MSCSTMTSVRPSVTRRMSATARRESSRLSPAVGSSSMTRSGRGATVSAISSSRCSPYDRALAGTSRRSRSPTMASTSSVSRVTSACPSSSDHASRRTPRRESTALRTFWNTVNRGKVLMI